MRSLLTSLLVATLSTISASAQTVQTKQGTVQGTYVNENVVGFLGVPYAQPPTGSNAFKYPSYPPSNYTSVYNATVGQPHCMSIRSGKLYGSDDCLYVNVYVPKTAMNSSKPLPVMAWIPGGGFTNLDDEQGDKIVSASMDNGGLGFIYVYIPYRLGPIGYLALPGLSAEVSPIQSSGMYGSADQIAALRWIQDNIAAFGGDANQVTVAGESAGAINVCWLLSSHLAKGLFQRAILESGGCDTQFVTLDAQEFGSQPVATAVGCSLPANPTSSDYTTQAACVRNHTATEIWQAYLSVLPNNATSSFTFTPLSLRPFTDGYIVQQFPANQFANGYITNEVDIITGDCHTEGALWGGDKSWQTAGWALPQYYAAVNADLGVPGVTYGAPSVGRNSYPANAQPVLEYYGPNGPYAALGNLTGAFVAQLDIITSGVFACPVRRQARHLTSYGKNVYTYSFNYLPAGSPFAQLGAAHAAELPYLFGFNTTYDYTPHNESPNEFILAATIRNYWINFVATGNPNNHSYANLTSSQSSYTQWPLYNQNTGGLYLDFGTGAPDNITLYTESEPFNTSCAVWDLYLPEISITLRCAEGYTTSSNGAACLLQTNGTSASTGSSMRTASKQVKMGKVLFNH